MRVVEYYFIDYEDYKGCVVYIANQTEAQMPTDEYTVTDVTAQEIALHTAMCVNMEYISSWGLLEFISKLCEYVDDEDLEMLVKALNKMYGE